MLGHPSDSLAIKYFEAVRDAYARAERAAGGQSTRQYQIGNHDIQLCFAGLALLPLLCPAFEHLAKSSESSSALKVFLWDSESTGIDIPCPPWDVEDFVRREEIWRFCDQRFRITFNPRNSTYDLMDMDQNLAIYQVRTLSQLQQYESGAPLLQILEWWFDRHKEYILHAGAVGFPEGGVLLVGKGGSGKSSTAMACLDSGLFYVSDDNCLLTNSEQPYVASLYNSAKVCLNEIGRFSLPKTALSLQTYTNTDKALFFLSEYKSAKILSGFPVRAVLIPQITGSPNTDLISVSPSKALLSLAPSTIFHIPGIENHAFRSMSRLVKQVPCYVLKLGTDRSTIAKSIIELLR